MKRWNDLLVQFSVKIIREGDWNYVNIRMGYDGNKWLVALIDCKVMGLGEILVIEKRF
ncbi:hypothetical protein [Flavobacterium davisii]|uniref:hypothetical protein n=1 Tax=Flavobacterium davisii TaxID=2906077 RepID=UPI001F3721AE|nr:hypothetical protein [Flavobacterium davisii]